MRCSEEKTVAKSRSKRFPRVKSQRMISRSSKQAHSDVAVACTKCDHSNIAGSYFCCRCGKRLPSNCAHCKHNLVEGSTFCNHCGFKVTSKLGMELVDVLERGESIDLQAAMDNLESLLIGTAMRVMDGSIRHAADLLQMQRTTLYSRIKTKR